MIDVSASRLLSFPKNTQKNAENTENGGYSS